MWRTLISPLIMIFLTGFFLVLYQLQGGETLLFLLVSCMLITIYGVFAQFAGPRSIHISRQFQPGRVTAGENTKVQIQVTFHSWLPLLWLKIEDDNPLLKHTHLIFPRRRNHHCSYSYQLKAIHRGVYDFEYCKITWGDAFGWFTRSMRIRVPGELIVHPPLHPQYVGNREREGRGESLELQQSRRSIAEDIKGYEIREYAPSDGMRSIHWKSSARLGKLQVRIPEKGKASEVYLILDNEIHSYVHKGENGRTELSWEAYDAAVSLCASMLTSAHNKGEYSFFATYSADLGARSSHDSKRCESIGHLKSKLIGQLDRLARLEPEGEIYRKLEKPRTSVSSSVHIPLLDTLNYPLPAAGSTVYFVTGSLNERNAKFIRELSRQGMRVQCFEMRGWKNERKVPNDSLHFLADELKKEHIPVRSVVTNSERI